VNDDLERSLSRAMSALTRATHAPVAAPKAASGPSKVAQALGALAIVLIVAGLTRHNHALLVMGLVLAAMGGALFVAGNLRPASPGVKLGASVGQDAKLDESSTVEMGATVGARASLGPRSVVRMGADVKADAVLEAGAVVSWGATVGKGAVIGEGAVVGAGADVGAGARVPAGFVLQPGATFGARDTAQKRLEQLAAQFARLRSAGDGAARAPQELQQGVVQLRSELEAIADALEAVAAPPPDEALAEANPGERTRTR
jgi:UDP-3-O-[3-hydroxymyristoyl] glucosamine N-acyltransferase